MKNMVKRRQSDERGPGEREARLATLMRAVVDARNRLARERERLRSLDLSLRDTGRAEYNRQREKVLGEYREAMGRAREARMRLLRQLQERAA